MPELKPKQKPDPAVVLANNRRKREKDQRRKNYHDMQVQGTNNSLIVSKRSVEKIYNPVMNPGAQEWFKFFVPNGKRRSPAINRGYWLRMESIKQMVMRILAQHENEKIRVVNLGCGFDPLPFQLLSEQKSVNFEFFDFDYPELVQRKLGMMQESTEIMEVIGKQRETIDMAHLGVVLATDTYKLVGCNLNDADKYENQVKSLLGGNSVTIFIAEVSLAYMNHEKANKVIEISSRLKDSHVLVLEQIMPAGPDHFFARKMLYHFDHLRLPIQCVEHYSTKQKQRERFSRFFGNVSVVDLFESWQQLVSSDQKQLLDTVEEFAEHEEFIIFCQHYVVVHATQTNTKILKSSNYNFDSLDVDTVKMSQVATKTPLEVKFPAACEMDGDWLIHGGMTQTRSDKLQSFKDGEIFDLYTPGDLKPCARMAHSLTALEDGSLLLVGGRTRPGNSLSDVWLLDPDRKWHKLGELDGYDLSRVVCVKMAANSVMVYGAGRFATIEVSGMAMKAEEWTADLPVIHGCGLDVADNGDWYLVGGVTDLVEPTFNESIFVLLPDPRTKTLRALGVHVTEPYGKLIGRIGCSVRIHGEGVYIIGGAGQVLPDQETTVLVYKRGEEVLHKGKLSGEVWGSGPVFIGSSVTRGAIVGGGAVCYSFGSAHSGIYEFDWGKKLQGGSIEGTQNI